MYAMRANDLFAKFILQTYIVCRSISNWKKKDQILIEEKAGKILDCKKNFKYFRWP